MNPAIAVNDLVFRYNPADPAATFALRLPSLSLASGASLFLHGASGSGKSTLLNVLGGVLEPQAGRIVLLGTELSSLSPRQRDAFRADHIGFIFQQFNLLPYLSALENVLLGCWFSLRRRQRAGDCVASARQLLQALDIDAQHINRAASQLSVGQQQRVAAARALIGAPEILLADEPTSALDADRQTAFLALLRNEAKRAGATLVFVSHDLALAQHFDEQRELEAMR